MYKDGSLKKKPSDIVIYWFTCKLLCSCTCTWTVVFFPDLVCCDETGTSYATVSYNWTGTHPVWSIIMHKTQTYDNEQLSTALYVAGHVTFFAHQSKFWSGGSKETLTDKRYQHSDLVSPHKNLLESLDARWSPCLRWCWSFGLDWTLVDSPRGVLWQMSRAE